jgi:hypothetical protein
MIPWRELRSRTFFLDITPKKFPAQSHLYGTKKGFRAQAHASMDSPTCYQETVLLSDTPVMPITCHCCH